MKNDTVHYKIMNKKMISKMLAVITCIILLYFVFIMNKGKNVQYKPNVNVFLPNNYCGEFVVFWGENTPSVDKPPEFLSYNYYLKHPNAVMINLPEPYNRGILRFIYQKETDVESTQNPVFRMTGVGTVALSGGTKRLPNGHTTSLPDIETGVDADIFTITQRDDCRNTFDTDKVFISELYIYLLGEKK